MTHIPVLQKEVIEYLSPKPNENFIDATIGEGSHTIAILETTKPDGKVLGIDQDPNQIENCKLKIENFKGRVILVNDNFANLKKIVENHNFKPVTGILFDLGMSSWHLEKSGRGFSFQRDEPLDMRYHRKNQKSNIKNQKYKSKIKNSLTAEIIVNKWSENEIEKVLKEYGEERFAKRIAKAIVETRNRTPIKTTFQLVEVIKKTTPYWYQRKRLHFATRTFQALRIAVNDELENLKKVLPQALEIVEKGGRIVIISFHSLEDRIVKNFFRQETKKGRLEILTKKPIRPSSIEIQANLRSRSAKLRAAVKL